jgi:hypothetical protein
MAQDLATFGVDTPARLEHRQWQADRPIELFAA